MAGSNCKVRQPPERIMIKLDLDEKLIINKHWYVAFSGGPDSTCLLNLLIDKKKKLGKKYNKEIQLSAIHINHNLRPVECVEDMEFCRDFCKRNNVEFISFSVDVESHSKEFKKTIEQAARDIRYEIFDKYSEDVVFLGHNKDDNAETVFMNMIRGTGLSGLTGMDKVSGHYIRPLLGYSKKQIMEYNNRNNVEFIIDSSNLSNHYMRNFIRNEVFPLINIKTGKDITNNLNSMASLLKETEEYIIMQTDKEYDKRVNVVNGSVVIDTKDFDTVENVIRGEIVRKAINQVSGKLKDVEKKHIELILKLISNSQSGSIMDIKDGVKILVLQNSRVKIFKDEIEPVSFNQAVSILGTTNVFERSLSISAKIINYTSGSYMGKDWVILDYDSVIKGLVIRNRQQKDKITPHKGNGTKTLKKYLIDNKVDNDIRDKLFVLAIENEIVYIENKEIGKRFIPKKGQIALRLEFKTI